MASKVEVILLEDVKNVGKSGELAEVKRGYARNWLLPQGFASIVDASTLKAYAKRKSKIEADGQKRRDLAEQTKADLQDKLETSRTVIIKARAGETGKLFGSITKEILAEKISEQFDITIAKTQILTKDAIRNLGEYEIKISLLSDVDATVKVKVEAE